MRVIVFAFWGRRGNVELQLPFIHRILSENSEVEFHGWNLARKRLDGTYLQGLQPSERVQVRHEFYSVRPWRDNLSKVYQHYCDPQYKDCLFVKIDDDIVFLESRRFGEYVKAVDANRGKVVSASVINNGACTRTEPGLWAKFVAKYGADTKRLLEVHQHKVFAEAAHRYFWDNWRSVVEADVDVVPTEDWLSINAIGFDWSTMREIVDLVGKPSPREISGRAFPANQLLGDEGAANMLPRVIMRGFVVAHLAFGPQNITREQEANWRRVYAKVSRDYLTAHVKAAVA